MAKYKANISETRYYPSLGVLVQPGDEIELPSGVDAVGLEPITKSKPADKTDDDKE